MKGNMMKDKSYKTVSNLRKFLQAHGYRVRKFRESYPGYPEYRISGHNIWGLFALKHKFAGWWTDGRICVDHVKCFDKLSKCPLIVHLPSGPDECQCLLSQLRFWGSKAGYNLSRHLEYDWFMRVEEPEKSAHIRIREQMERNISRLLRKNRRLEKLCSVSGAGQ
jgi:hypothetical protein